MCPDVAALWKYDKLSSKVNNEIFNIFHKSHFDNQGHITKSLSPKGLKVGRKLAKSYDQFEYCIAPINVGQFNLE